jgi:hypothetical protein
VTTRVLQQAGILGIMLACVALAALYNVVREWRTIFDDHFTARDRMRITPFVLFILLPLSVLLHEGGHAVMVKAFGGHIVGFGFYLFYGYVDHVGNYTYLQLAVIAVAGTVVNVILGLGAAALAWYRPRRAAINYMLFVFAGIELANALIFYPLLDAFGGVAGDWEIIYSRHTPLFSALIGINHAAILLCWLIIWRNPRFQRGYAERTGLIAPSSGPARAREQQRLADLLADAATSASADWKHPVAVAPDAQAGGAQVVLRWESGGFQRALLVHANLDANPAHRIELHAAIQPHMTGAPPIQRPLARINGDPTAEQMAPHLRHFLDLVDSWNGTSLISPN